MDPQAAGELVEAWLLAPGHLATGGVKRARPGLARRARARARTASTRASGRPTRAGDGGPARRRRLLVMHARRGKPGDAAAGGRRAAAAARPRDQRAGAGRALRGARGGRRPAARSRPRVAAARRRPRAGPARLRDRLRRPARGAGPARRQRVAGPGDRGGAGLAPALAAHPGAERRLCQRQADKLDTRCDGAATPSAPCWRSPARSGAGRAGTRPAAAPRRARPWPSSARRARRTTSTRWPARWGS